MSSKEGSYAPLDLSVIKPAQKQRVSYYYDEEVSTFTYGAGHPMKPQRINMTHSLVMNTGVFKKMALYRPIAASAAEMAQFHSEEYVDFLSRVTPQTVILEPELMFGMEKEEDCPAFEGVFRFNALCAGGSLEGAARLARENTDIAINWAGGLHHAKKEKASGFCYINDIVLGIMELLRFVPRVLYIDIDFHHGDGVEEAFLTNDRVMTVSFHQYGGVFPFNTGALGDIGDGEGRGYSVNFPLQPGMNDRSFKGIFESVINQIMVTYRPSAIVLQCGADSLSGDRVGKFNLSMRGHANCVKFVKRLSVPTLVLGGGGYTIRNVARTWAYETGVLVGEDLRPDQLPVTDQYYQYYAPDFKLDVRRANQPNRNSFRALEATKTMIFENLRNLAHAPSVQMQDVPRSSLAFGASQEIDDELDDADEDDHPDVRTTTRRRDQRIQAEGELSDSDNSDDTDSSPSFPRRQSGRLIDRRRNTHDHGEAAKIARTNGHCKCESTSEPEAGVDGMLGQMRGMGLSITKPSPKPSPTKNLGAATGAAPAANRIGYRHPLDDPICDSCKKGKVKCDKARPFCATCVRRKRTHLCIYRRLDGTPAPDPQGAAAAAVAEPAGDESSPRRQPKSSAKGTAPFINSSPTKASSPRMSSRAPKEPTSMVTRANAAVSREVSHAAESPGPGSKRSKLTRSAKSGLAAYAKDEWQEGDFGGLGEEDLGLDK